MLPGHHGIEAVRHLDIAREIQARIRELSRACSVGIAPNKLLAKMASDMKKPNGHGGRRNAGFQNSKQIGILIGDGAFAASTAKSGYF